MSEINDLLDELVSSASTLHYVIDDNECPDKAFEDLQKRKDAIISEITALKQRITEIEAERRWIPIGERKPEKEGFYLTFDEYGNHSDISFRNGRWNSLVLINHVTHWMPLPEKPEATA